MFQRTRSIEGCLASAQAFTADRRLAEHSLCIPRRYLLALRCLPALSGTSQWQNSGVLQTKLSPQISFHQTVQASLATGNTTIRPRYTIALVSAKGCFNTTIKRHTSCSIGDRRFHLLPSCRFCPAIVHFHQRRRDSWTELAKGCSTIGHGSLARTACA